MEYLIINYFFEDHMKIKAFTLAEIMIVLTIIGVITAILLPIAISSAPDENIMKFKKGHNTLLNTVRELVNSDKYYLNGDLGIRASGALIDTTHDGDYSYFCKTFADIISIEANNCDTETTNVRPWIDLWDGSSYTNKERYEEQAIRADEACAEVTQEAGVKAADGIYYYEPNTKCTFGITIGKLNETILGTTDPFPSTTRNFGGYFPDPNNPTIDTVYKTFCMDIDGINKGEDPFGYGIRSDGKVFAGKRATEWLKKSIQEKE